MMEAGLLRIRLETAAVIVSKRGKGGFYTSTRHIPSSTMIGALARRAILENVSTGLGNCSRLRGPNQMPDCLGCDAKERCIYYQLWMEKKLKVSDALKSGQKGLRDPPAVPSLQSLFENREKKSKDGLLYLALTRKAIEKKLGLNILFNKNFEGFKKSPKNVGVSDDSFKKVKPELTYSPHVGISGIFRAAEEGLLYSHATLSPGSEFVAPAFADEGVMRWLKDNSPMEIEIGSQRSRGYGYASLFVDEITDLEEYIEGRTKEIDEGFQLIGERVEELTDKKIERCIGTLTGLTSLPLNGGDPNTSLSQRIGVEKLELLFLTYKRGVHTRYDFQTLDGEGPSLTLTPVIQGGYGAVFEAKGRTEDLPRRLAETEVSDRGYEPWFGWVYFNHPIHYSKEHVKGG